MKKLKLKNHKYYIYFITVTFLVFITVIISIIYLNYIRNLITENTYKNMAEIVKLDVTKLQNTMAEHKRILGTIVNEIEQTVPKTEEELFQIYERNSGKDQFSRMGILYKSGQTVTNDGEHVDLSDDVNEFFNSKKIQLSKSRKSKIDEQEINIYSENTVWNGEEVVILLVVETNKFEEIFSQSIYNGKGAEYIITDNGEIIANSRSEQNGNNIFTRLSENSDKQKNRDKENLSNLKKQVQEMKQGQITYEIRGHNYYIAYQDLDINNWNLMIITYGNAVAEELNQILVLTFLISIFIIFAVLTVSIYISMSNIKKRKDLYNLAYIDQITNLGNYNYFIKNGEQFIKENENIYLIVLDIDKFKYFNKKYSYKTGSDLLYNMGKILKQILDEKSIVCRLANDMFAILIKPEKNINYIVEKIENRLKIIEFENNKYNINLSIGIYKIRKDDKEVTKILDKALIPHAQIKGIYNIQHKIFDEEVEMELEKEHEIELIMEDALRNEEFEIYYQPKISTKDEKIKSAEALVRWKRKDKMISPGEFIPVFEKNHFITKLDKYIYEKVCIDLKKWKEKYNMTLNVSVNVSKENFMQEDFIKEYLNITKKYGLEPKDIELEITESAYVDTDIENIIKRIKREGFKISIDDFGTGYSSLSMLQNMDVDTIKIDKSFIDEIKVNKQKDNIVQFIILLAKQLNLETVAEGVETEEQVDFLRKLGCDLIQGYYYSRPLRDEEFERFSFN